MTEHVVTSEAEMVSAMAAIQSSTDDSVVILNADIDMTPATRRWECPCCFECTFCGIDADELPLPRRMICLLCYEQYFRDDPDVTTDEIVVAGVKWVRSKNGEWHSHIRGRVASQEGTPEELHDAYEHIAMLTAQCDELRGLAKRALDAQKAP